MNMPGRVVLVAAAILSVLAPKTVFAAPFHLLMDIYPGPNSGADSYMVSDGSQLFFWGHDGVSGSAGQPWASDGTVSGTHKIGDFVGSGGAFFDYQPRFAYRGVAYFVVYDGFTGRQLWRSDGTFPGTFALTNVNGGLDSDVVNLTPVGGVLVFEGGNASYGYALTSTDGSVAGTQVLSSTLYASSAGVVQKGHAVFLGSSGPSVGLIVTDGTPGGTSFFTVPGLTGFSAIAHNIAAVNETVYFVGVDGTHGTELWQTDGTQGGTAIVRDIYVGSNSSFPNSLTRVDDRLFFVATTPGAGKELWMSDGTLGGTVNVKDIHLGLLDSSPAQLTALNGVLYFVANDGTTGNELWRSDGTGSGTTLALGDFNPGAAGAFDYAYNTVQAVNHKLALVMGVAGAPAYTIPYVSDGSLVATQPMDATQTATVFYSGLVAANGRLFASGTVPPSNFGNELIATDAFATLGNTWCANAEESIPDNLAAGLNSRFRLPGRGGITALSVSVDIGHTYVGDLSISLRHEQTGTQVTLFNQPGACSGALLDIVFDDAAASSVQATCSNARLAYPRDQSYVPANPLAAFAGEALRGDWTLNVVDHKTGDVGILHEWCMNFTSDLIFADGLD
ncbi:MAG TPA: ELWxxDGT repeat protein [Rudaea sp.]|nr:ELWxxDGT repeat protein [Rudaea sp.]